MKYLYASYGVAAVLWVASLLAVFLAIWWALRPTHASLRKAIALAVFALVVGFLGSNVFQLRYHRSMTTTASYARRPDVVSVTNWSVESRWFFRVFAYLGAFALIFAVIRRVRLEESPKESRKLPAQL